MSSLMTRHSLFSPESCGLSEKPSLMKKSVDLPRSFTGMLTQIFVDISRLIPLVALSSHYGSSRGSSPRTSVRGHEDGLLSRRHSPQMPFQPVKNSLSFVVFGGDGWLS